MLPSETQQIKNNDRKINIVIFVQQGCVCLKVMKKLHLFFSCFYPFYIFFPLSLPASKPISNSVVCSLTAGESTSGIRRLLLCHLTTAAPPLPSLTRHVEPAAKVSLNSQCIELPWRVKQWLAVLWRLLVFYQHPSKHFYSQHTTLMWGRMLIHKPLAEPPLT